MYTHTHMCMCTHIHIYTHTLRYMYAYAYLHRHIHTCMHTHTYTLTIYAHMLTHSHLGMRFLECRKPAFQVCLKFHPQLPQIAQTPSWFAHISSFKSTVWFYQQCSAEVYFFKQTVLLVAIKLIFCSLFTSLIFKLYPPVPWLLTIGKTALFLLPVWIFQALSWWP